jgi:MoaA/NifB/PqqE/SkfB family radical SAM enzyme
LLDAGKDFLDADSHSWLLRKWEREQSLPQLTFAASYACQAHCPYCYAQDVDQYQPGELTLNSFLLAIDWAERQGCRIISFAGGEPTLHPLAEKFFEEVRLRGLRTYFNSNLLCDPDVIADFDGSWVTNIGIHAQAARFTPREQRVHFERNVEGLRSRGVPLFLRYTFEHQNEEAIGDALTLACTLGVKQVNFAIPMPSLSRRNRHAGEKQMRDSGHFLVRATEAFRAAGLTAILSKPIPPCAVPEDKLEFLRAGEAPSAACNLPRRGWTQNVLVAPDLTISPCVGVPTAGPSLLDFQSFHEVSEYLVRHLQSILRPTPFEECAACNFRLGGRCLGGCLAYFVEANQSEKGPLSQLRV